MARGTSSERQEHKRAVGVFSNRGDAEYALTELRDAGFNMNKVSVIANANRDEIAGVETQELVGNTDEKAAAGAVTGTVFGGITGLIVGLGTLAIPGVGPILLVGEIASTLATAAAGAGIGAAAGSLFGAFGGLGIPEENAVVYNERVSQGDYLVIVDGTDQDIHRAENILTNRGIKEFGIYNAPLVADTRTNVVEPIGSDRLSNVADNDPKVIVVDRREDNII